MSHLLRRVWAGLCLALHAPFAALAPEETASASALPLTLFIRPGPLLALGVLALNDHVLKGGGDLPAWLTGKLSDVAGLLFFPLLLVTLFNLFFALQARLLGHPLRWQSASTTQVAVACMVTGAFFTGVQTNHAVAFFYAHLTASLSFWAPASVVKVTSDFSDLLALPALLVALIWGRRGVGQLPPGRLAFVLEQGESRSNALADVLNAARPSQHQAGARLLQSIANAESPERIDVALRGFRKRRK